MKRLKIHKIRKTKVKIFIPVKFLTKSKPKDLDDFQKVRFLRHTYNETGTDNPLQDDSHWFLEQYERTTVELANLINSGNLESVFDLVQRQPTSELANKLLNLKDRYYKSPLTIAIQKNDLNIVNYLLQNKVNVNSTDNFNWTPLHHASFVGNTEIALELIKHGARINARSAAGTTALMLAIKTNNQKMVKLLLNNKAKFFFPANLKKENVIDIAKKFGVGKEILELIVEKTKKLKRKNLPRYNRRRKKLDNKKKAEKIVAVKVPNIKVEYKLIRPDKNLHVKKNLNPDCAKIRLFKHMPEPVGMKTKLELAVKNREIHGNEYDFPGFKTPWEKKIEEMKKSRKKKSIILKNKKKT